MRRRDELHRGRGVGRECLDNLEERRHDRLFDTATDRLFVLDLVDGSVSLREQPWAKQGDVINWLVSDSFGLRQGRSIDAERAIEAAEAWMRGDRDALPPGLATQDVIHAELLRVLPGHDPFWPRWIVSTENAGAAP